MQDGAIIRWLSAEHVAQVAGLTMRQLTYWDDTGLFNPTLVVGDESSRPIRLYSFEDAVGLRVIAALLQHKASLQHIRKIAGKLQQQGHVHWARLRLAVCKGEVVIVDSAAKRGQGVLSGQYVLVPIIDEIRHTKKAVAALNVRQPDQIGATANRRNVAHNERVFAGTRIPVRAVRRFLDAGYSADAILKEYPSLKKPDIEMVERERQEKAAA